MIFGLEFRKLEKKESKLKLSQVIESKDNQNIHVIGKNADISEAAELISRLGIGSLVVSSDGSKIEGILSERDIVRDLGASGAACLKKKVSELMTEKVQTLDGDADTKDAMRAMSKGGFRHLPVTSNGDLIGMISIRDVVSARLREMELENSALTDMISGAAY